VRVKVCCPQAGILPSAQWSHRPGRRVAEHWKPVAGAADFLRFVL